MSFHLQFIWMDIFFFFLSGSLETTWGFISQTSSCRFWWAGGNSFKISCALPEAEFVRLSTKPRACSRLSTRSRAAGTGAGLRPAGARPLPAAGTCPASPVAGAEGRRAGTRRGGEGALLSPQVAQPANPVRTLIRWDIKVKRWLSPLCLWTPEVPGVPSSVCPEGAGRRPAGSAACPGEEPPPDTGGGSRLRSRSPSVLRVWWQRNR